MLGSTTRATAALADLRHTIDTRNDDPTRALYSTELVVAAHQAAPVLATQHNFVSSEQQQLVKQSSPTTARRDSVSNRLSTPSAASSKMAIAEPDVVWSNVRTGFFGLTANEYVYIFHSLFTFCFTFLSFAVNM
jgi:hypothetical protein